MICRPPYMYCTLHNYSHSGQLVYILTLTSYNHAKPPEAALKQLLLVLKLQLLKSHWSAGILLVSISIISNLVKVTEDYVMSSMKTKTSPEWR